MAKNYIIKASAHVGEANLPIHIEWKSGNKIEREYNSGGKKDQFGDSDVQEDFRQLIAVGTQKAFAPLSKQAGITLVIILVYNLISWIPIVKGILLEPLARGWRLEIVRRVALDEEHKMPSLRVDSLLMYFLRGLVLIISRYVYFIPLIIISLLSAWRVLNLATTLLFLLIQAIVGWAEYNEVLNYTLGTLLPQLGVEILIELVLLSFYVILIWPIYRIIMVQFALKKSPWYGFFSPAQIRKAFKVFRKNASSIYGIYGLVVSVDVVISYLKWTLIISTFGLALILSPTIDLIFRHWIKGYAYGMLGKELIQRDQL